MFCLGLALLIAGCRVSFNHHGFLLTQADKTADRTVDLQFPVELGSEVVVGTRSGTIEVHSDDISECRITAEIHAQAVSMEKAVVW